MGCISSGESVPGTLPGSRCATGGESIGDAQYSHHLLIDQSSHLREANKRMRKFDLKAIKRNPEHEWSYTLLADQLCANETVTLLDGRVMTEVDLWVEALRFRAGRAVYYNCVVNAMRRGQVVRLHDGRVLSWVGLLLESLRLEPDRGTSYTSLAIRSFGSATLPDGRLMNTRELLIEGFLKDPQHWFCMIHLAHDMSPDETVTLSGVQFTRQSLFVRAISMHSRASWCYLYFAHTLQPGETVHLHNGRVMQREQLWSTAIRTSQRPERTFTFLAWAVRVGDSFFMDGRQWTKLELCIEAIKLSPKDSGNWVLLATAMMWNDIVISPDGSMKMTRQQVLLHAVKMEPAYYEAYYELARLTGPYEIVKLHDGRRLTKHELWHEAARLGEATQIYKDWADTLSFAEKVTLRDGRVVGKYELYAEAIRLAPGHCWHYDALGQAIKPGETCLLHDGRTMTKHAACLEAIMLAPERCEFLYRLAMCTNPHDQVTLLDGRRLTQRAMLLEVVARAPSQSFGYRGLALTATSGERITLRDDRKLSAPQLWTLAFSMARDVGTEYHDVASLLSSPDASIELEDSSVYTQRQLYLEDSP
jgi:hypothetical protein